MMIPVFDIVENTVSFPTLFSTNLVNFLLFSSNSKLSSADCLKLDLSKILSSGNGLNYEVKS